MKVKSLNQMFHTSITPNPKSFHFTPFLSFSAFSFSTFCDKLNNNNNNASTRAVQPIAVHAQNSGNNLLQVVLVSPQIPGNTGAIARTCAASGVKLHLVEPLGFPIDDTKLKRAGLDYWPYVVVKVHPSWTDFRDYFLLQDGDKRLLAFTKKGTTIHSDFTYKPGDWLLFGSETSGLPPEALSDCKNDVYGGGTLKIPMVDTYVRCLNLSVSVGIAIYEAARQLNYEQLQGSSEAGVDGESPFVTEDVFG
ncbi:hypothetical protein RND81_11G124300 [Saponaria officinalis]|uniref:tRNA/rRNA methyltransferase SpoU type domain-containing protein n=1 Tax=Saponaria officinalis TaxID=3572 RepID=A0AAW1HK90_SAPOF